ncbi:glycosyltransferase [Amycolatopsis sp. lyj-23]|uniref:glycosyltransferase n=1 Tax=Amycolatopsis sp. lyj-23 TaxID=2789283 RepID=UPI003979B308
MHVPPDPDLRCVNGKVAGVITGLRLVRAERVIIADDDVRYDGETLAAVAGALDGADLVVPQNYFRPTPCHCRWDTARSLLNRAFAHDYPGTLAVRRTAFHRFGCYDGEVLFENLELIRTVRARGGTVRYLRSPLVRRLPPDVRTFLSQRVRQAYDSFAQLLLMAVQRSTRSTPLCSPADAPRPAAVAQPSVTAASPGSRFVVRSRGGRRRRPGPRPGRSSLRGRRGR